MTKNNVSADMGSRAKAMKTLLRTCTQLSGLTKTTILATNHIYEDPSAMFPTLVKAMPGGYRCSILTISYYSISS